MSTSIRDEIVTVGDETFEEDEGCLSLPGLLFPVERAHDVVVEGIDQDGEPIRIAADDLKARVFQHEVDHLNGVLFIDHLPDELRRRARTMLMEQALGLAPGG